MIGAGDRIQKLRKVVEKGKALRALLQSQISETEFSIKKQKREIEDLVKTRAILSTVAKAVQDTHKEYLEGLVTLALRAVIDRPYDFTMEFKEERGKDVCLPLIYEDGHKLVPKDEDVGGGALDICSFALQVAMIPLVDGADWILWSDEPFSYIGTGDMAARAGQVIKYVNRELGIQIIMNTHDEALIEIGDRVWKFRHNGKYTEAELVIDRWKK